MARWCASSSAMPQPACRPAFCRRRFFVMTIQGRGTEPRLARLRCIPCSVHWRAVHGPGAQIPARTPHGVGRLTAGDIRYLRSRTNSRGCINLALLVNLLSHSVMHSGDCPFAAAEPILGKWLPLANVIAVYVVRGAGPIEDIADCRRDILLEPNPHCGVISVSPAVPALSC